MDNNLKFNTLERQLREELQLLGFPPANWLPPSDILDVVNSMSLTTHLLSKSIMI